MSFEEIMESVKEQVVYDIRYFKQYGIKSAMLQRICNQLNIEDYELVELI